MIEKIKEARKAGDSLGGVVEAVARGVPPGLGEPVFDKLDADLTKGMVSIPACKGVEIGSGFGGVTLTGSEHNDPFYSAGGRIRDQDEPVRRHPRGNQQRREHRTTGGFQASGHDHAGPGHG